MELILLGQRPSLLCIFAAVAQKADSGNPWMENNKYYYA